jgi:hypothetical protein
MGLRRFLQTLFSSGGCYDPENCRRHTLDFRGPRFFPNALSIGPIYPYSLALEQCPPVPTR